jgi:hypothetical protein
MWFMLRKYPVQQGAHAEVTGISARRSNQRGTLLVTYPGGKARTAVLSSSMRVRGAMKFAAKFNAACHTATNVPA